MKVAEVGLSSALPPQPSLDPDNIDYHTQPASPSCGEASLSLSFSPSQSLSPQTWNSRLSFHPTLTNISINCDISHQMNGLGFWQCKHACVDVFFSIIPLICTTQAHIIDAFLHGVDLCCMSLKLLLLLLHVTFRLINSCCCVLWCLINPADCCLLSTKLSRYIQTVACQLPWFCERCVILPAGEIYLLPNRFFF